MANEKKVKSEIVMAESGEFLREYGTKYFLVISEALSIGRVKWSMIPLDTNGKKSVDFYMTTEQMALLCKEISSGLAERKIAADKTNSYPSAYRYVTGDDGSKKVNIGGGEKVPVRIQMQDLTKNYRYMIGINMETLKIMALKFNIYTGMVPVNPSSYYGDIVRVFTKGRREREKYHEALEREINSAANTPQISPDAVLAASMAVQQVMSQQPQSQSSQSVQSSPALSQPSQPSSTPSPETEVSAATTVVKGGKVSAAVEMKSTEKQGNEQKDATSEKKGNVEKRLEEPGGAVENFHVFVKGAKKKAQNGGYYTFPCNIEDQIYKLLFRVEDAEKIKWFDSLEERAATDGTPLRFSGVKKKNCILYTGKATN